MKNIFLFYFLCHGFLAQAQVIKPSGNPDTLWTFGFAEQEAYPDVYNSPIEKNAF
jgi:hypothetical protein